VRAGRPRSGESMSTVSVIIPLFNDAAFVAEALESVLAQSRAPDDVVVVDDGSTDGGGDVARRFAPRITVLSQDNQGISAARNAGIRHARGDVIAFLDADDLWPADSLRLRLERLETEAALDGVFGEVEHFISPETDDATRARLHCPEGRTAARFAGAMLVRRRAFERVGYFDTALKVGETLDWAARLNDAGSKLAVIDELVMRRRIHGGNTMVAEQAPQTDYFKALRASLARKQAAAGRTP